MTRTTNARLAGLMFLFFIAVGITQMVLGAATRAEGIAERLTLMAQHPSQVRVNVVLTLLTSVTALTLAVALYGITREQDHELALLALSCRVGEGILTAIGPMATLGLLSLGTAGAEPGASDTAAAHVLGAFLLNVRVWNTTITATLFAVGSTLFSWLLLRGRMVPVPLAWLGVVASVLLVVGLPLQLVGALHSPVTQLMWLPMAAFEIPLALWLLIKGVAVPAKQLEVLQ